MEKKLLNPKKALKRLMYKLQLLKLPHWIQHPKSSPFKPTASTSIIHHRHKAQKGVSLVYRDKFYIESSSIDDAHNNYFSIPPRGAATDGRQSHDSEKDDDHHELLLCNPTYMSLKLHGVDAKAEEFIRKGKEAWMIERQKSAEEFVAMLARGT